MEKRAADQDFRSINSRLSIRVHGQFYSSAKPTPLLRVFASPPPFHPFSSRSNPPRVSTRLAAARCYLAAPCQPGGSTKHIDGWMAFDRGTIHGLEGARGMQ